ncbi:MAG: pyridoxamine 5'-phosphate oxidase family protein [Olsenella sp.]|nr:pyridoxamine 5'-phosphate oxidase family protein [Olsenella sp.]
MFREMRRIKQQLSAEECERILREQPRGVLCVHGEDGYPYGVPIDFLYQDGRLFFHGAREGHKIDALAACDKVCLTVLDGGERQEGEWWYTFNSVICFGRCRVVEDDGTRLSILRTLGMKYIPTTAEMEATMARSAARTAVLEMEIDYMTGKAVKEK